MSLRLGNKFSTEGKRKSLLTCFGLEVKQDKWKGAAAHIEQGVTQLVLVHLSA